jgi:hypothetical protein
MPARHTKPLIQKPAIMYIGQVINAHNFIMPSVC